MGAFFLKRLDERMERSGLFYMRFMDNIRVFSRTRWKIRKVVEVVNGMPGSLGLEKHPDKTFIGRVERDFDFLGYHFGPDGITVAEKTMERFVRPAARLYQQGPGEAVASSRFGRYMRRWGKWAAGRGLGHDMDRPRARRRGKPIPSWQSRSRRSRCKPP